MVMDWENVELSEETRNPDGAVTMRGSLSPLPLTVKDCEAEAEPLAVVKAPRLEGVAVMVCDRAGRAEARRTAEAARSRDLGEESVERRDVYMAAVGWSFKF